MKKPTGPINQHKELAMTGKLPGKSAPKKAK
jgi:hypothetical protein